MPLPCTSMLSRSGCAFAAISVLWLFFDDLIMLLLLPLAAAELLLPLAPVELLLQAPPRLSASIDIGHAAFNAEVIPLLQQYLPLLSRV